MSEVNNHIQQLVDLQKLDDNIFELEATQERAPLEVSELQGKFETIEARRKNALDKMAHLQEQKKRLSLEIDDDSARIRKSKNKMMQVGNAREYNAMIREMDNMERSNRTREEERGALLEALEEHQGELDAIEKEYNEMKEVLEARKASLDQVIAESDDKLAVMAKKRANFSEGIPTPIFRRYEFIRKRLAHPVIVSVEDGICSGCHIAIPPQIYIDLQQAGTQILSCPNCQRLIYWKEKFEDPDLIESQEKTAEASNRSQEQDAESLEVEE